VTVAVVRQIAQRHKEGEMGLLSRLFGRSHRNSRGTAVCEVTTLDAHAAPRNLFTNIRLTNTPGVASGPRSHGL